MRVYIALIILTSFCINYAASQCTFPSDLTGTWYSSTKGVLNITTDSTQSTIQSYSTTKFGNFELTCNTSSGNYYMFQSNAFTYLNLEFRAHFCFYLATAASSTKYIYYLGSTENTDADNERYKTKLTSIGFIPSVATVCDRTSYAAGAENIFLKNDGSESDNRIDFPFDMRGTWSYNFTSGTTSTCSTNSSANICTASDTSTITFDYDRCSSVQAYSANGVLYNMWYSNDTNYLYFHLYNTDSTTDESTTYRFTCYVVSIASSTSLYASQYPQSCQTGQTPTSVSSPGATLDFTLTEACPYDTTSSVISTASAVGITLGVFFIVILIVCGVLIWYYYKKRKEREAIDKLPLQKSQPANKRLTNGDLFRDSKSRASRMRDSKTPATMNGDARINFDTDPGVRRENSICISMNSRGGSGMGLEDRIGPAPVEVPDKVNYLSDDIITETDNEATLASTFLPISPTATNKLHYTDKDIEEIEKKDNEAKPEDEYNDMDAIDDELGLPRLSRAFTPVNTQSEEPVEATLPAIDYKKEQLVDIESGEERTADGVLKVKLKKKKKRIRSAKQNIKGRSKSTSPTKNKRETPFLERIKKLEEEKVEMQQRQKIDKEMKNVANGDIKARLPEDPQHEVPASSNKYLVDIQRDKRLRSANKRSVQTSAGEHRRRFGDPIPESARANRKRTPRIRHPMEIQKSSEENKEKGEKLQKPEGFWRDEKLRRSGRSRQHPEARTIPSVKEDPLDHREKTPPPSVPPTRSGRSALKSGFERENSAFIDPVGGTPVGDELWNKAANMWHFKNQPSWGNLGLHHK